MKSRQLLSTNYLSVRADQCEMPDGRVSSDYYVLEFTDWVNIVALTADRQIVLIEQYRHAAGEVQLEIPGGVVDAHKGESPIEAASRELAEETGYSCAKLLFLGRHRPNPALQNNWVHTFLAMDCQLTGSTKFDAGENINTVLKPLTEVEELVRTGGIKHSIIMASLWLALLKLHQESVWMP